MTHYFNFSGAINSLLHRTASTADTSQLYVGYLSGVDGVKNLFDTLHYFDAATVHVELNGLVQKQGDDYSIITDSVGRGTAIEFAETPNLIGGADELYIKYRIIANKQINT